MRQRRTALKHVLSWERVQGSVDEPIHNSCSVRDQSRMEPIQPNDPALVPFEGQPVVQPPSSVGASSTRHRVTRI